ncbi:dihydroxyacetone kinase subunit DhaK [Liquorilactobacillus ghanensis]|uniref:dihydroxyacetone kinase subunit DhaK n=1 Tax=Liquorilactobacillus ghanensis TaxID=399370 RepID=UPI0039EBE756
MSSVVTGHFFTSLISDQIYTALETVNNGKDAFLVIKDYSGAVINFDMTKDMAEIDNILVKLVAVDGVGIHSQSSYR